MLEAITKRPEILGLSKEAQRAQFLAAEAELEAWRQRHRETPCTDHLRRTITKAIAETKRWWDIEDRQAAELEVFRRFGEGVEWRTMIQLPARKRMRYIESVMRTKNITPQKKSR